VVLARYRQFFKNTNLLTLRGTSAAIQHCWSKIVHLHRLKMPNCLIQAFCSHIKINNPRQHAYGFPQGLSQAHRACNSVSSATISDRSSDNEQLCRTRETEIHPAAADCSKNVRTNPVTITSSRVSRFTLNPFPTDKTCPFFCRSSRRLELGSRNRNGSSGLGLRRMRLLEMEGRMSESEEWKPLKELRQLLSGFQNLYLRVSSFCRK